VPTTDDERSETLAVRLKRLWYRYALGLSPTQAQWRIDREAERAAGRVGVPRHTSGRLADPRFHCVCGHMLVRGDTRCPACARRQLLPFPLRVAGRFLADLMPSTHPATHLLLALIGLGYVLQLFGGRGSLFNPVPVSGFLFDLGASSPPLTLGAQPWRAITYQFLHGGALHLLMNCMNLLQVGPLIEGHFGSARMLTGFLVTGAAGVVVPPLFGFGSLAPTVGASGALFGLMGMAWLASRGVQDPQTRAVHEVVQRWIIYAMVFSVALEFSGAARIAHGAHVGGLLAGLALAYALPPPLDRPSRRRVTPWVGLAGVVLLVAALAGFFGWRSAGAPQVLTQVPELNGFWLQSRMAHEERVNE
jgi:membrane associated rhomboid family serine protease